MMKEEREMLNFEGREKEDCEYWVEEKKKENSIYEKEAGRGVSKV